MFVLRCPKCGHDMKYHTRDKVLTGKRKRCVYCGFSMGVKSSFVKRI